MMKNVLQILRDRGFIQDITDPSIQEHLESSRTIYCGFDPTGESLHVGHLVPLLAMRHFLDAGHRVVGLIGGATGMIGDPSGKSQERNLLSQESVDANVEKIRENIIRFLPNTDALEVMNNAHWWTEWSLIPFLREVGKMFRMGPMLSKESVKQRIESEEGLSFTEFCYQLLQGYDFHHLNVFHGVTLQMGGSDQWGNITAGIDLVRKFEGPQVYGLTCKLLTRSDGKKFGKTESGAVYLCAKKTSPFAFYQYFVRTLDQDVIRYMKLFTLMPLEEIQDYENPTHPLEANTLQKRLAFEVTALVHGVEEAQKAQQAASMAKPGAQARLDITALKNLRASLPYHTLSKDHFLGKKLTDLLVENGVKKSKGEVRRLVRNGGLYLNNDKVTQEEYILSVHDLIENQFALFALGKKHQVLFEIIR